MYAEVTTALASLKSLGEIAKLLTDTKAATQVFQKTAELNTTILTMQETLFALHSEKDVLLAEKKDLEEKLAAFEQWETDSARYELQEVASGVFAYVVKPSATQSEPSHWLCANCYQKKRKAILQKGPKIWAGGFPYACPNCKATIEV